MPSTVPSFGCHCRCDWPQSSSRRRACSTGTTEGWPGMNLPIMAREHPDVGVVSAAGREAGDQCHRLVAVEIGDRVRPPCRTVAAITPSSAHNPSRASGLPICPMRNMSRSLVEEFSFDRIAAEIETASDDRQSRSLPHQQHRIGSFRHALPGVGVVLFEAPGLSARREQHQFAVVHAPGGRIKARHQRIAAGLELEREIIGAGGGCWPASACRSACRCRARSPIRRPSLSAERTGAAAALCRM